MCSTLHILYCCGRTGGNAPATKQDAFFPADLLFLAAPDSADPGLCYIETAQLDGEANLKIKRAPAETRGLTSDAALRGFAVRGGAGRAGG